MNADGRSTGAARTDDPHDDGQADVRDLLGAYALNAVDDVERRAVERLVAADPETARELAGLVETAALLGGAVAAKPPAEVRAAVLAQIGRTPQVGSPKQVRAAGAASSGRADRVARRSGPSRRTAWLAVADPAARVVHANVTGGGVAVGILAGQRALFTASGLADPGVGKVYQLWVLRDGKPLPDAVLPNDAGCVRAITDKFAAGDSLAVTIEPTGGSMQPTTAPVVVLAAA
ncbi:MAG: hypothetical protein HHJ10_05825 [Cellulomonas sp.]|uniref:anti-sigma factor n=1 Tax=Cellulomonas sp. TaxID=40001 RepID=UPI0018108D43|nr:anti-sigma factor [Cellulomonas sp.]NMM30555.1 hypothetical protein [Cellulomonas sp.]